jgi:hypothetical protein
MEQIKRLAGFGSLLCCILLSAPGLSAQVPGHRISDIVRDGNNTTGYTFCKVAVPHPGGATDVYYSDVFSVPQGNLRAASDAFVQFLAGKYSLQLHLPDSTCENLLSARQADAQSRLERTEGTNSSFNNVFKTGWTYSGGGSAGAAPAPPAPAASVQPAPAQAAPSQTASSQPAASTASPSQQISWVSCAAPSDPRTVYMSAMFSTTRTDYDPAWPTAFASYLKRKYGYQGYASCNKLHSAADEQAYMLKSTANFEIKQNDGSPQKRVVHTDWTYKAP